MSKNDIHSLEDMPPTLAGACCESGGDQGFEDGTVSIGGAMGSFPEAAFPSGPAF